MTNNNDTQTEPLPQACRYELIQTDGDDTWCIDYDDELHGIASKQTYWAGMSSLPLHIEDTRTGERVTLPW